jgi:hypothetical protein
MADSGGGGRTCSDLGPDTLRVFSNCDWMRVIMPRHEMYDRRESG